VRRAIVLLLVVALSVPASGDSVFLEAHRDARRGVLLYGGIAVGGIATATAAIITPFAFPDVWEDNIALSILSPTLAVVGLGAYFVGFFPLIMHHAPELRRLNHAIEHESSFTEREIDAILSGNVVFAGMSETALLASFRRFHSTGQGRLDNGEIVTVYELGGRLIVVSREGRVMRGGAVTDESRKWLY
jgi:hypothetical protein